MASGSYTRNPVQQVPLEEGITTRIPARATRKLPSTQESRQAGYDDMPETRPVVAPSRSLPNPAQPKAVQKRPLPPRPQAVATLPPPQSEMFVHPRGRTTRGYWLKAGVICLICAIGFLILPLSVGIFQRPGPSFISINGKVYDPQVGGDKAGTWEHPPETNILPQSGPYVVLHDPSITADLMNQVLSAYKSPAAGKGQALYDLGVQYGIDPAFALAFFMHESSFGTQGEATKSLSLGNLRCIPNFRCEDNFAQFDTWEDGFKAWYQLIRNLYIAQWGLTTVDQIIPHYAPQADHNNEQGYIAALKHALDTWHAGQIFVR
jgi:Mannosyl-glycoprotein endo-beta-N-acetylglucosaminidase